MRVAERYAEAEKVHNPKKRAVEQISVPTNATDDPVMVTIIQESPSISTKAPVEILLAAKQGQVTIPDSTHTQEGPPNMEPRTQLPPPFRIPAWEAAELSYLNLAITNLNNITRSYNLMAPDLAKKPYFSLERELKSCYADIAPQLAQEIKERAMRPVKELVEKIGHKPGGVLERFATDQAKIYDSKKPKYGFKDFWNDLWGQKRI
jgi:hypothetical protein